MTTASMKFYTNIDFRQTDIGNIPLDWEIGKLGDSDIANIIMGQSPPSATYNKNGDGLPFLQGKMEFGEIYPVPAVYCSKPLKVAEQNDVLLSVRAPVGDANIAPYKLCIGRGLAAIRFNPKRAHFRFYFYYFKRIKNYLENLGKGSTFKAINREDLENLKIPVPPIDEQRAIVEVLSVVDLAIQKTDEVIAKTERLKKGLMQTLLTRGIGHKEFKETEIGKIPKTWQIVKLKEIAEIIMGQSPPSSTYNEDKVGLPFLQGKMEFGELYPSPTLYCSQPIKIAEPNDVLISVRAPVGDVNLAPFRICIGRGLAALRFKKANYLFYFYYLQKIRDFLENLGKGSTFKAITKDDLEGLNILCPPFNEQHEIATILFTIDEKLIIEKEKKSRLEKVKHGLMDLLLTGKIRVKVD